MKWLNVIKGWESDVVRRDQEADSGVEDAVGQVEGSAAEEEETGVTQTFTASVTVLL